MADAFDREDVEAVADCLGDDAAQLRQENDEDERADNMDRAASMLTWMLLTHPVYASGVPVVDGETISPSDADAPTAREAELIALLRKAREGLSCGLWDYGAGQDEHEQCDALIAEIDATLKEPNDGR